MKNTIFVNFRVSKNFQVARFLSIVRENVLFTWERTIDEDVFLFDPLKITIISLDVET